MENNQKTPLISLIVPFYNGEMYLKDCIKSIIEQDYQNIELILVDDGSSDNSKNIADRFAKNDKRISVYHQNNSGVSTARNVGIEKSRGEYIGFIDADDYIDKSKDEKIGPEISQYRYAMSRNSRLRFLDSLSPAHCAGVRLFKAE